MDLERIVPGIVGSTTTVVTDQNSTARGSVQVFSTPAMIQLMEKAAHETVAPFLGQVENTVGIRVEVRHLAPSLMGTKVEARATLLEVDGRKLKFKIEAFDAVEKVGEGEHDRFIIDTTRYQQRLDKKMAALRACGHTL